MSAKKMIKKSEYVKGFFMSYFFFKIFHLDWVEEVIPHPTDETREIFKYHEFTIDEYTFRWFYDRKKNTKSTECKDKKLYCVHCKECFSAHTSEKRFSHDCKQEDLDRKLNGQAESDKIKL